MPTGTIRPIRIEDEMRSSFLDYAMSVIVARALPDVRDGLKPVHRRILYAMDELGMRPGTAYKKSARLVGEVLGKYHPHGDSPVYDAMVRLAQDFSMRYPLIDGQGNFGSVDDDPPAAMRYTEARLALISQEMLTDIDQETVEFSPNFDASLSEPTVLPARLPNLLINGSSGIAVGMTTSIPPHNLSEVCDAIVHLIDHPESELDDLMQFIQGPDFPTAGILLGKDGIREAYETGRGRVVERARVDAEEGTRGGRWQLVVTELPYTVNKAALVEKIARLAKEKKIDGISDVRDESGRQGMRVVIELRRDAQVQRVKNNLFKHTALQSTFYINMLALVDGQPQTLPLKSMLQHYIDFRIEVIRRRTEFDIRKASARAHILEGLRIAINDLDAVIKIVRAASDIETARQALIEQYNLDTEQAQAILEMQLRRLAALERKKIEDEYNELTKTISRLKNLLSDPSRVLAVVSEETQKIKKDYGDSRRSALSNEEVTGFTNEELIPHQEVVITLSQRGYIKCVPAETYRRQHRGGKGIRGQSTREGDILREHLVADTHDLLMLFTNTGRVYRMKVYELPTDISRVSRGMPLVQALNLRPDESVNALLGISPLEQDGKDILFGTRLGEIKRMALSALANIRSNGLNTMDLEPGDELVSVRVAQETDDIVMVTQQGMSIRFPAIQVRRSSRLAGGVRGIRLRDEDRVISMDVMLPEGQLLVISQRGYGKPTSMERYRLQARGGYGLATIRTTSKSGLTATARVVKEGEDIMIISERGQVTRTNLSELRERSRRTQGVSIVSVQENDKVVSITSMDAKSRHQRDTTPRPAAGNIAPVIEISVEEPSTNGHQLDTEEN